MIDANIQIELDREWNRLRTKHMVVPYLSRQVLTEQTFFELADYESSDLFDLQPNYRSIPAGAKSIFLQMHCIGGLLTLVVYRASDGRDFFLVPRSPIERLSLPAG